jgi:predicted outer membrane protein
MLRHTPALAVMLATASVSAQQAGSPQPGSPQRPAQTTQIQGADQNQTRERNNTARPNAGTAQTPQSTQRNNATDRQPGRRGRGAESVGDRFDSHVADCLILGNQEEVALLKFGMERTKSEKVKELAQSMIKDHEKAITELREFASPQHANDELTADQGRTREALKVPADADKNQAEGGRNNLMAKMHQMAKRAHEQCLILSREELAKYEGHEFDQAFLGQQLGAHIGMLAKLKAAQEETSGELSTWTGKAQETTKQHKDHLEKLMNDLGKEAHSKK